MSFPRSKSQEARKTFLWAATTFLACAHFALSYTSSHRQFLDLAKYAHGQERTPFQYRTLEAWILRLLGDHPISVRVASIFSGKLKDPYILTEAALALLCLGGATLATRRSVAILSGSRAFASWASLMVVYMAYFQYALPYGLNYVLPYDLPSLLFFSLAFMGIVSANAPLFYAAFLIGTLNRETAIFLIVPFVVWSLYDASGRRVEGAWARVLPQVTIQVVLWAGVKMFVSHLYAGRTVLPEDAGLFETHVRENVISLVKPYQWPLFASLFGFALPFLFVFRNRIADARLRNVLMVLLPLWALAMLVVGVIIEVRIFGELTAFVAPGAALILWSALKPLFVETAPPAASLP